MRKFLLITFVVLTCILVIAPKIGAQQVFLPTYIITGNVADPENKGTAGRQVVFYKDDPINGYADDIVGPNDPSLSTFDNVYFLNACEDWRLTIAPGTYNVAIVKGNDGYGAGPNKVTVTGQGVDVGNLVLAYDAGIAAPGPRPSHLAPRFEYIRIGERIYQKEIVAKGEEFVSSPSPRVETEVKSAVGINLNSLVIVLNEGQADAKSYDIKPANIVKSSGPPAAPLTATIVIDWTEEKLVPLPEGDQNLTFKAANAYGQATEIAQLTVLGGPARVLGIPITFPSPLDLKTHKKVEFQYILSHDLNIEIYLFDVSGRVVMRKRFNEREEGGSAGINKVTWDLITDQGTLVSSGIYVWTIVDVNTGKLLARGKFTALPRQR